MKDGSCPMGCGERHGEDEDSNPSPPAETLPSKRVCCALGVSCCLRCANFRLLDLEDALEAERALFALAESFSGPGWRVSMLGPGEWQWRVPELLHDGLQCWGDKPTAREAIAEAKRQLSKDQK